MSDRDFAGEVRELEAGLARDRQTAVARLRVRHEDWARALLGIDSRVKLLSQVRARVEAGLAPGTAVEAAAQLANAEKWQWEIGTWSSGSGEGLASMFEVRTLQLAQAWLLSVQTDATSLDAARELAKQVESEPNNIMAPLRKNLHALFTRLKRAE